MSRQKSLSKLLDQPELRFHRERMEDHATYIEHKFEINRGRDIKPEKVEEILGDLNKLDVQLRKMNEADGARSNIETISLQCEAALIYYNEKDNPARYLETLKKKVLPLLKNI